MKRMMDWIKNCTPLLSFLQTLIVYLYIVHRQHHHTITKPSFTVNSEINACIYYCDSSKTAKYASLIIAISAKVVTNGF